MDEKLPQLESPEIVEHLNQQVSELMEQKGYKRRLFR